MKNCNIGIVLRKGKKKRIVINYHLCSSTPIYTLSPTFVRVRICFHFLKIIDYL